MHPFRYVAATDIPEALAHMAESPTSRFLAGGTTLVDLMKSGPEHPSITVDINRIARLRGIHFDNESGVLRLGALEKMSDVGADLDVRMNFPAISESLLFAASGQLRNMASLGGNLLQRTRCLYFRDHTFACNKREPGMGCSAIGGVNRFLAVLGTSPSCIANYPGDFAVALAALDGVVHTTGRKDGDRSIPAVDLHTLPGEHPEVESVLSHGELITHITIHRTPCSMRSHYLKVRDRSSYEFASVSVAAGLDLTEDGTIRDVRIALGGLAAKPWRAMQAEDILRGRRIDDAAVVSAAVAAALVGARAYSQNGFKITQARAAIPRALHIAAEMVLDGPRVEGDHV